MTPLQLELDSWASTANVDGNYPLRDLLRQARNALSIPDEDDCFRDFPVIPFNAFMRHPALGAEAPSEGTRSPHWPAVEHAFILANPKCAACGRTHHLNVHHKKPFHDRPELELDPKNLITLCITGPGLNCHLAIGHIGDWHAYNPDVVGDAAEHLLTVSHKRL